MKIISKDLLQKYYVQEGYSINRLRVHLKTSAGCIRRSLSFHNIKKRSISEQQLKVNIRRKQKEEKILNILSKEKLIDLYYTQKLSVNKISKIVGITHKHFDVLLEKYDLEKRSRSDVIKTTMETQDNRLSENHKKKISISIKKARVPR